MNSRFFMVCSFVEIGRRAAPAAGRDDVHRPFNYEWPKTAPGIPRSLGAPPFRLSMPLLSGSPEDVVNGLPLVETVITFDVIGGIAM